MKRIIKNRFITAILLSVASLHATAQPVRTAASDNCVFVFCGKEIPKDFSYIIERKTAQDAAWKKVGTVTAPADFSAMHGNIMAAPVSVAALYTINETDVRNAWKLSERAVTIDSLYFYAAIPMYVAAAGCGWWDTTIHTPGEYEYRITKKNNSNNLSAVVADAKVVYPATDSNHSPIRYDHFSTDDHIVHIFYSVTDAAHMMGVQVLRSAHLENKYAPVSCNTIFYKEKGSWEMNVTDNSVAAKIAYDYIIAPYDRYGHMLRKRDTVAICNIAKPKETAMFEKARGASIQQEKGIRLTWKISDPGGLVSVDVYRSTHYDSGYTRIISLAPHDTVYTDPEVQSVTTYYYKLVANGYYGESYPSARIPVIQKAYKVSRFPPQELAATRTGNKVTLSWLRTERDVHGYYIYRGTGYKGALQKIRFIIASDSVQNNYTDTLPFSTQPEIYTYAVSEENTSYSVGPLSVPVSVTLSASVLPAPQNVTARYQQQHIDIFWDNVYELSKSVTGCIIYRTATDDTGRETESKKMIGYTRTNSFADTAITEGWHYAYYIQSVGLDSKDVSVFSSKVAVTIPGNLPLAPVDITAVCSGKKVTLSWHHPFDASLKKIKIYRTLANGNPVAVGEVNSDADSYTDENVHDGTTYFYVLSSVNETGRESRLTDALGVHVK